MPLFVLAETSAGYALLKSKDKQVLQHSQDEYLNLASTAQGACSLFKLRNFAKYDNAATALEEAAAIVEGKVTPMLAKLLEPLKEEKRVSLAVADSRLANAINRLPQFSVTIVPDAQTTDIYRTIRTYLDSLIPGMLPDDVRTTSLGLSHSLSRHKLKFSPDKVDVMIIAAISLLDELDKELNIYAMRMQEWYGWHFPELAKNLNDNIAYARIVAEAGERKDICQADLSAILTEEKEKDIKELADKSMGSEVTSEDLLTIRMLAEEVVSLAEYRVSLSGYLRARMEAIAPNLTALVGDTIGARLIAHSGSLLSLAKCPASTVQILGAEKALFRALKTKHDTPKYGILYHASLVGKASGKNKGKIARMLATKATLSLRMDSLADWGLMGEGDQAEPSEEEKARIGNMYRIKLERRLRNMEGKPLGPKEGGAAIGPAGQVAQPQPQPFALKETRRYNVDADGVGPAAAGRQDKGKKRKMIEEVDGDGDHEMSDANSVPEPGEPSRKRQRSESPPATNGHAKINGAASEKKEAKKAKEQRRAEKAARKAAKSAEKEAKLARKEAKRAAKAAKAEKPERAAKTEKTAKLEKAAKVDKIEKPEKADKAAKAAKKAQAREEIASGKKRKQERETDEAMDDGKKKKKHKSHH